MTSRPPVATPADPYAGRPARSLAGDEAAADEWCTVRAVRLTMYRSCLTVPASFRVQDYRQRPVPRTRRRDLRRGTRTYAASMGSLAAGPLGRDSRAALAGHGAGAAFRRLRRSGSGLVRWRRRDACALQSPPPGPIRDRQP